MNTSSSKTPLKQIVITGADYRLIQFFFIFNNNNNNNNYTLFLAQYIKCYDLKTLSPVHDV